MPAVDSLTPTPVRPRHGWRHLVEDLRMVRDGVLDRGSFRQSRELQVNPVEVRTTSLIEDDAIVRPSLICTDPTLFTQPVQDELGVWRDAAFGMRRRVLREVRRSHNLRVTMGRDQIQRLQISGDVGSGSLNGLVVAYTGTTATTLTGASGLPTAASSAGNSGLQGHLVIVPNSTVANTVIGVIVSNTATAITVDQWYALPCTGAVGTTPTNAAGTAYVLPGGTWTAWIGLSTASAAAAAGDVLRTADGLFGDGTGAGAATEQSASGLARTYVAATLPSAGNIQYQNTWTYTGASLVTIPKVVMCNSKAVAGSLMFLETLLNASGTVSNNGDTLQVTWTVTL